MQEGMEENGALRCGERTPSALRGVFTRCRSLWSLFCRAMLYCQEPVSDEWWVMSDE
jgi:hypothetical protein